MGILRSKVNINDLELLQEKFRQVVRDWNPAKGSGSSNIKMSNPSAFPEINVLGMTVDEAVAQRAHIWMMPILPHLPQVRIVHGKGTGALRAGITNI